MDVDPAYPPPLVEQPSVGPTVKDAPSTPSSPAPVVEVPTPETSAAKPSSELVVAPLPIDNPVQSLSEDISMDSSDTSTVQHTEVPSVNTHASETVAEPLPVPVPELAPKLPLPSLRPGHYFHHTQCTPAPEVVYTADMQEANRQLSRLQGPVLGLDMEWPIWAPDPRNKGRRVFKQQKDCFDSGP